MAQFGKILVGRNIIVLSKTELDNIQLEYDKIVNSSETSNRDDKYDVWNQSDYGIGPGKNAEI